LQDGNFGLSPSTTPSQYLKVWQIIFVFEIRKEYIKGFITFAILLESIINKDILTIDQIKQFIRSIKDSDPIVS